MIVAIVMNLSQGAHEFLEEKAGITETKDVFLKTHLRIKWSKLQTFRLSFQSDPILIFGFGFVMNGFFNDC